MHIFLLIIPNAKIIMIGGDNMYEIINYTSDYEKDAKQLMIDISVKEYGFKEFEKCFLESDYEKYKKSGGNFWIVLNKAKKVIGTMALEKSGDIGYLSGVYIHSEYRGNGIAQKLLELSIEHAKEQNIDNILLDTYANFESAVKFYERNNFIRYKEEKEKYYYKLKL